MAYQRVKIKSGLFANLPAASMLAGELFGTTDRKSIHMAIDATTLTTLVPAIDTLATLASIDGAADLIMIHDADAVGMKEKKVTFNAFKAALSIPAGSTDEKVAVVSGGTPGYIFGTDGTDGIIRVGSSLLMTKHAGNAYVTLEANIIDCGTF